MKRLKAFKFRLYPTRKQAELINKTCGCKRLVYNAMLELRQSVYKQTGKSMNRFDCNKLLPGMKAERPFLKEVDSTALQAANDDLDAAYKAFFTKKGGCPTFHKKGHNDSYTTKANNLKVDNHHVFLPKLGWVKFAKSREVKGHIKRATVSRQPSGRYYISILCEVEIDPLPVSQNTCGVDMGYRKLATLDDGTTFENPKALHTAMRKLVREQRKLSRRVTGSANREKQRVKVARLHEHIANIRRDTLHKVTTTLIRENQTICIEDLDVKRMLSKHYMAKLICDVGLAEFRRMLEYKADWYGRQVIAVSQDYPSSQTCNICGQRYEKLGSRERWTCPHCGTVHDRDINAAINIKRKGLELLTPAA